MGKKQIVPSWTACGIGATIALIATMTGFYALIELDQFIEKIGSPFWETVIICTIALIILAGATILYEKIVKRYDEMKKKTSDK